jgi:putative transposase
VGLTLVGVARPLRLEIPDGVYHVFARGNERRAIYRDDSDRERFLEVVSRACERFGWRVLSYCLMTNHYHLLVRTPDANLARGMRDLNGVYAQRFNRRHGRDGHLFQGRYGALLVERGGHLLASVAYIVRNPVRAGLCASPREWRWSSQRAALGERPPGILVLDELLGYFGSERASARRRYRELTESGGEPNAGALLPDGVVYGTDEYVRAQLARLEPTESAEIPSAHLRPPRRSLTALLVDSRPETLEAAYAHGYTMPQIARQLGLHPSTISRRLARRRAEVKT